VVDVTDRADVAVRLIAFEFFFCHFKLQPCPGSSSS
jgi:hypothetical protein